METALHASFVTRSTGLRDRARSQAVHRGSGFTRPPADELTESILERHLRFEADQALRLPHIGEPPPYGRRLARRTVFGRTVDAHHAAEHGGEFGQARLSAA